MLRNLSLKAQLTLLLSVVGVLAVLAIGLLTRSVVREQAMHDQSVILTLSAQRVAARLERHLSDHIMKLRATAELEVVRSAGANELAARAAALEALRRWDPQYAWVAVVSDSGVVLASSGKPSAAPATLLAAVSGPLTSTSDAVGPGLRMVTTAGGAIVLRLQLKGGEGRRTSSLVAELSERWTQDVRKELASLAATDQMSLLVLDRDGRVRLQAGESKDTLDASAAVWLKALMAEPDGVSIRGGPDGSSFLIASARATGSDAIGQLKWAAVARRPAGQVFEAADRLASLMWALGLASVGTFGALMWLILQRQLRPLRELTQATARIRHNDLSGSIPVPVNHGEVTEFARTLSALVSDLQARNAQLRLFSRIYEESRDGIMVADDQLLFLHVNAAFTRITGYRFDDVVGHSITLLRRDRNNRLFKTAMLEAVQKYGSWEGEVRSLASDGHIYAEWLSLHCLRDENKRITHYIGIFEDISEIKRNAEELEQHRHRMEELLQARTAALTQANAELQAAREASEQASRAKSDFLANMSHEIRTPMNAILGLAHLLQRSLVEPRQIDQISKITVAARHLLDIINDILDLSKIEAGKLRLEIADFRIDQVLDYVLSLIADRARARGLELVMDSVDVPAVLAGDGLRLGQILLNFASNAVKFTEQGHIALRVHQTTGRSEGMWLRFEVQDTGIGMNAEQLSRIFEAFEQADTSTSRKFGGTGLGLTISRRLVTLMGGRIGVDSEEGRGTTSWIEIPLRPATGKRFDERLDPALRQRLPKDARVLVVDDLPATRTAQGHVLRALGLFAVKVPDVASAVRVLAEADGQGKPFALVLCDAELPDQGAVKVRAAVLSLQLSTQPLLMLTTVQRLEDLSVAQSADLAPCVAVIEKPLGRGNLVTALQQALLDEVPPPPVLDNFETVRLVQQMVRRRGGARVLIAEDNAINQEVSRALLREVGIEADLAEDGAVAVELARNNDYELILMDMQMPVTDGLVATRLIRQLPAYRDTPILALTANAFDESREACLEAGMDAHLSKPIDPVALYKALLQWLPGMGELTEAHAVELGLTQAGALPELDSDTEMANTLLQPTEHLALEYESEEDRPTAPMQPPADPQADLHARLGHIRGLDVTAGLATSGGLTDIYVDMLHMFLDTDVLSRLQRDAASGDLTALRKSVHTLKGVAGTLGMKGLQRAAVELENDLRASPPRLAPSDAPARVKHIVDDFEALCADLRASLPPPVEV